jgi:hypothetical protein
VQGQLDEAEWRFCDPFGREWRCHLLPASEASKEDAEPEGAAGGVGERVDAEATLFRLMNLAFDPMGALDDELAAVLLSMYDALSGQSLAPALPRPSCDPDRLLAPVIPLLRETLEAAAQSGLLQFEEVVPADWNLPKAEDKPVAQDQAPQPIVDEVTTWIDIELKDDEGKPVKNARYSILLPNGTTRTGRLDDNGKAREDGLDPGTCTVSFPDFEGASHVG